ncbi:MAG: hypothetical protein KUG77_26755 [Nannocystaceae bacterium]|nr:hypothetical protein [Nannocystaceae bacterium]
MKNATLNLGLGLCTSVLGCGDSNPKCDELAAHVTKVLSTEKGGDIPQEAKDKATKDIVGACNSEAPPAELLDCALKAETKAALVACDKLAKAE